jgi:predicted AAA+ superfamily ATPase
MHFYHEKEIKAKVRKWDLNKDIRRNFLCGSYPELVAASQRNIQLWHSSYIQTYPERDVRTLRQVGDLTQFQSFLRALAAGAAQLISLSNLARDFGDKALPGYLIHPGNIRLPLGENVTARPFSEF